MKKVLIISHLNEEARKINSYLQTFFQVQLCSDNIETIRGMVRLTRPDLILVCLKDLALSHDDIFPLLSQNYWRIPVTIIGSLSDEAVLTEEGYLPNERYFFLQPPFRLDAVVRAARELLRIQDDELEKDRKKTILLVDDNPTMLRTLQAMLSPTYRVTFATSGPQALAVIAKDKPDLILLDYEMPICDGKMTFEMLRSEENTKDIPVIFLTGIDDFNQVMNVLNLLPDGYLLKPPTEEKIFSTIEEVLKAYEEKKHNLTESRGEDGNGKK